MKNVKKFTTRNLAFLFFTEDTIYVADKINGECPRTDYLDVEYELCCPDCEDLETERTKVGICKVLECVTASKADIPRIVENVDNITSIMEDLDWREGDDNKLVIYKIKNQLI